MNMLISNFIKKSFLVSIVFLSLFVTSCKKENDDTLYQVNEEELLPSNVNKKRLKTNEQYVSILYANLFQKALSANKVYDISQCFESIGDKVVAREVLISNFMNKPDVLIPSVTQMNANVEQFVIDTYKRFYIRLPTEAEKEYIKKSITADPNLTPELVYMSFALSDEYMYY